MLNKQDDDLDLKQKEIDNLVQTAQEFKDQLRQKETQIDDIEKNIKELYPKYTSLKSENS